MRTSGRTPSADQSGFASDSSADQRTRTCDMSTLGDLHHCHDGGRPCRTSLRHAYGVSLVPIQKQAACAASLACDQRRSAKGGEKT